MCFLSTNGFAQEDVSAKIEKITAAYEEKTGAFRKRLQGLSREEQSALYNKEYPDPAGAIASIKEIVKANPESDASLEGIKWVLRYSRTAIDDEILSLLEKHHLNNEKTSEINLSLAHVSSQKARAFLKAVREKSEIKVVRGTALYALAMGLERQERKVDEHVALLEELIKDYPDLSLNGRSLVDRAKGKLFAARNLAVGKVAPEIVGKDVDGKEMKLSDYRGKIVVIDFWGDW